MLAIQIRPDNSWSATVRNRCLPPSISEVKVPSCSINISSWHASVQCCGSMKFWYGSGSGSAGPYGTSTLMDPDADPDPAIFVSDLQDVGEKIFGLLLFKGTFTSFFKDKKSQRRWNQCFSYYFCLTIEGSGPGSGSLTNGSRSGAQKHIYGSYGSGSGLGSGSASLFQWNDLKLSQGKEWEEGKVS